ncbi:WD40-repeat-containing domain protein [Polychytrium aggregatum]|uniref:WD40-repeat-containing domain protein n=1 Tax=Polychytrium aggregatum TaxID=110093 RepID=UPI0022FE3088|nr:WD40-repeat-containing domain protein [Polychytrium aggregatum]KAI9205203.1 WD40-repeat-containing domain protein [Polychytrium aggregatum]
MNPAWDPASAMAPPDLSSSLLLLPTEVMFRILGYLHPRELCRAGRSSRRLYDLAFDHRIWRVATGFQRSGYDFSAPSFAMHTSALGHPKVQPSARRHSARRDITLTHGDASDLSGPKPISNISSHRSSLPDCRSWTPPNYLRIYRNWTMAQPRITASFLTLSESGITSLALSQTTLAVASESPFIEIWDLGRAGADPGSRQPIPTHLIHNAHLGGVNSIVHLNSQKGPSDLRTKSSASPYSVVSAGRDKCIRLWDMRASLRQPVFEISEAHQDEIFALQSTDNYLVSAGADEIVQVFDLRRLHTGINASFPLHSLEGHTNSIYDLHFINHTLVTVGGDGTAMLWDLVRGAAECWIWASSHELYSVQLSESIRHKPSVVRFLTGSENGTVRHWTVNRQSQASSRGLQSNPSSALDSVGPSLDGSLESVPVVPTLSLPWSIPDLLTGDEFEQEWDLETISAMVWDEDARRVIAGGWDATLRLLDLGNMTSSTASSRPQTRNEWSSECSGDTVWIRSPSNALSEADLAADEGGQQDSEEAKAATTPLIPSARSCVPIEKRLFLDGCRSRGIKIHHGPISCLQTDASRVVTGSLDCTVKVWSFDHSD